MQHIALGVGGGGRVESWKGGERLGWRGSDDHRQTENMEGDAGALISSIK